MAVVSQISVGDITYYQVDDIPSHTAAKGSVAILGPSIYNNGFTYINNDGGTTWLKCISPSYGEISLTNGTTGVVADNTGGQPQVLGEWYAFNSSDTWVLNSNSTSDWILANESETTDDLKYTGSTTIRGITSQFSTMRSGTGKWISWETGISLNFLIPSTGTINESFGNDNAQTTNQGAQRIIEFTTNDYILGAISPISREGGGGTGDRTFIPKHFQLIATKIDEPLIQQQFLEDWESSGFTENSWTIVNDSENIWVVGQAENNTDGGTSAAYTSNDGGTSATYNINNAEASHFYKDFTFYSNATSIELRFDWKCQGENAAGETQYDYGAVVITTTGTTPVAGTEVSTTQATAGGNGRIGADSNAGKFNLNYGTTPGTTWNSESIDLTSWAGETKRLVFTWKNDGSVGTDPPFIVDNIKIINNFY